MRLRHLLIENFRGIRLLELDLDDTTVLIGENNSGKTAVLDAVKLCLRELSSRRRVIFEPYDLHLKDENTDPTAADPIRIELTFAEKSPGEWDGQLTGRLARLGILQVDPDDGRGQVALRVTCAYDRVSRDLSQSWAFLNRDGHELPRVPENALRALREDISYFYLSALRDAGKHFDAKGEFWRPFLQDSQLSPEKKAEIEAQLKAVNDLLVGSHGSFEQVKSRLKRLQDVVPVATGEVVSIEAVPGRLFDILAKAQIHLGTNTGAKIPVGRHGEGTQSLAVLMLFAAFLETWPSASPILGLEEPESHLHPSAIRALWKLLDGIAGQKIISTHSGDLLSEVPIQSVRRLAREAQGVKQYALQPGTLTPEEERKLNFHIRYARAELLFARCWILVEGETEVTLLPELARVLGCNLERAGVRCVPFSNAGLEVFLKVANDFGIRWCVLSDNDQQGTANQRKARAYLQGANLSDALHVMQEPDIEQYLCSCGFGAVYESLLSAQTRLKITVPPGDPSYWQQVIKAISNSIVKPAAAQQVVASIQNNSNPVPPLLEQVIRSAVRLAEG
jgi:putative ATP-dependent endonuclease of OLD family